MENYFFESRITRCQYWLSFIVNTNLQLSYSWLIGKLSYAFCISTNIIRIGLLYSNFFTIVSFKQVISTGPANSKTILFRPTFWLFFTVLHWFLLVEETFYFWAGLLYFNCSIYKDFISFYLHTILNFF